MISILGELAASSKAKSDFPEAVEPVNISTRGIILYVTLFSILYVETTLRIGLQVCARQWGGRVGNSRGARIQRAR